MHDFPITPASSSFKFHARGAEFFGIFWVNTLLTIVTLGLYYPWAKVRTTRYLFGCTELNESRFEYHATAKQLFKGFLLVYSLLVLFFVVSSVAPPMSGLMTLLAGLAMPWLLVQSIRFKAFMTSYRGIRFEFDFTTGKAYLAALVASALTLVSGGMAIPWLIWRFKHLIVNNLKFGNQAFICKGTFWRLAKVYLLCSFLYLIPIVLIVFFSMGVEMPTGEGDQISDAQAAMFGSIMLLSFGSYLLLFLIVVPLIQVTTLNNLWDNTSIGGHRVHCKIPLGSAIWVLFKNGLLTFLTLGLYYPFAVVNWWRLRFDSLSIDLPQDFEQIMASERQQQGALGESAADVLDIGFAL